MSPSPGAACRVVACLTFAFALACAATTVATAQDKTPQPPTIGPAVPLSPAQQAASAAKPRTTVPARIEPQSSAPPAKPGAPIEHRVPSIVSPSVEPIPAGAMIRVSPDGPAPARSVVAPVRAWSVSPALGPIPRPEWRLPGAFAKPADRVWIGTPEGGRRIPVTTDAAAPSGAGGGQ